MALPTRVSPRSRTARTGRQSASVPAPLAIPLAEWDPKMNLRPAHRTFMNPKVAAKKDLPGRNSFAPFRKERNCRRTFSPSPALSRENSGPPAIVSTRGQFGNAIDETDRRSFRLFHTIANGLNYDSDLLRRGGSHWDVRIVRQTTQPLRSMRFRTQSKSRVPV